MAFSPQGYFPQARLSTQVVAMKGGLAGRGAEKQM